MAQTLTTPVTNEPVVQQGIVTIILKFPHARNVGDTAMELNKPAITLTYEVADWDTDGIEYPESNLMQVPFSDWPAGVKTDVRDFYAKAENHAVANGMIGPGTPEVLN